MAHWARRIPSRGGANLSPLLLLRSRRGCHRQALRAVWSGAPVRRRLLASPETPRRLSITLPVIRWLLTHFLREYLALAQRSSGYLAHNRLVLPCLLDSGLRGPAACPVTATRLARRRSVRTIWCSTNSAPHPPSSHRRHVRRPPWTRG